MPSVVQRKKNPRRGRPRKVYPRLIHRVAEWSARSPSGALLRLSPGL